MAGSRCNGPLGLNPLRLDSELVPARTPGPLGRLDAADADIPACLGDTPGPLGIFDHSDPAARFPMLPPLNFERSASYQAFEEQVLDEQIRRAQTRRPRAPEIPAGELEEVEGGHRLRKDAAIQCRALLKAARQDLAAEQAVFLKLPKAEREAEERRLKALGQAPVSRVERIGITSAYRSFEYDSGLWHRYVRGKYYSLTYSDRAGLSWWDGGPFGWKAVESFVSFISKRKAAPGFSNHTNGIAVDFFTREAGQTLQAETGRSDGALRRLNSRWEKSWFYRWLEKHKSQYGVDRIATEAWHWEFRH